MTVRNLTQCLFTVKSVAVSYTHVTYLHKGARQKTLYLSIKEHKENMRIGFDRTI